MSKELLDYNQDGDTRGFVDSPQIQHMPKRDQEVLQGIDDYIAAFPPKNRDPGMDEWSLEKELDDYLREYGEQAIVAKWEQFKQTRGLQ